MPASSFFANDLCGRSECMSWRTINGVRMVQHRRRAPFCYTFTRQAVKRQQTIYSFAWISKPAARIYANMYTYFRLMQIQDKLDECKMIGFSCADRVG